MNCFVFLRRPEVPGFCPAIGEDAMVGRIQNVHDTSCFHAQITGRFDSILNSVIAFNDIQDKSNPNFWATRPLTEQMIGWASADVDRLVFDVATKQLASILVMVKGRLRSYNPKSLFHQLEI